MCAPQLRVDGEHLWSRATKKSKTQILGESGNEMVWDMEKWAHMMSANSTTLERCKQPSRVAIKLLCLVVVVEVVMLARMALEFTTSARQGREIDEGESARSEAQGTGWPLGKWKPESRLMQPEVLSRLRSGTSKQWCKQCGKERRDD